MEPFWYENLLDKGCQLHVWVSCHSLRDLKCSLLSPADLLPDACHHDPWGHDEDTLAPFFQWVRALILTQVLKCWSCDQLSANRETTAFIFQMENGGPCPRSYSTSGTEPEICSLDSWYTILCITGHYSYYPLTSRPEMHPSPERLMSCGKYIVLLFFNTVTSWDWFQSSLQWFSLTTGETVSLCQPAQIKGAKERELRVWHFKVKNHVGQIRALQN